jgi:glutamine cyclotransferase
MIAVTRWWTTCARRIVVGIALVLAFCIAPSAHAQFLMMPDSTNNRVVLFDPFNGALVNSNYFALAGGTPIHAMQVGTEIWVSEQVGDRISRWSLTGTSLGAITGALDNVRGMEQVGNTVYLCTTGTNSGAPGRAIARFDTAGNPLGSFPAAPSDGFGILSHQGDLLVSSSAANNDIERYSVTGTDVGVFHNSASVSFLEQMDHATNGDVLAAVFTTNVIARFDPNTGALLSTVPASGARGLWQLGNGNIMWTSGTGAFVFDVTTQTSTQVYAGGGRFIDLLVVPEPGTGLLIASATAIVALKRRRN